MKKANLKEDKIIILHIVSDMKMGGIESFLMNVLRNIDHTKYECHILTARNEIGDYDSEVKALGIPMYRLKHITQIGLKGFINSYKKVLRDNHFDVVHCHMNAWAGLFLPIAKSVGIPIRISHSHSSHNSFREAGFLKTLIKNYWKSRIYKGATHYVACGYKAGEWLFGSEIAKEKMTIVWNGIYADNFEYNKKMRKEKRQELGFDDRHMIIGNVGNLRYAKNHSFLIQLFNEMYRHNDDVRLVIVGEGDYRVRLEEMIKEYRLEEVAFLVGRRKDVDQLLSAYDVFVMTSYFEGFPVSMVEAQAASLPCIVSDTITKEVDINKGYVKFISLDQSTKEWSKSIMDFQEVDREMINGVKQVKEAGFSIEKSVERLCEIYRGEAIDE